MIGKVYILSIFIIGYALNFSCRDTVSDDQDPSIRRDSCVINEQIRDSTSIVSVYEVGDTVQNFGFATKVNKLSYFHLGAKINSERILIHLFSRDFNGDLSDLLIFNLKQSKAACFELEIDCNWPIEMNKMQNCSKFTTNYGDALLNTYILDTSRSDNNIEIVSIDTSLKMLEGRFACSFIFPQNRMNLDPGNPDTIRFFNGYFKGKYLER